jgi:GDP-L-fucose synthase
MHVDDLARACVWVMNQPIEALNKWIKPQQSHINIGSGEEISIADLARRIAQLVGFKGQIIFDPSKPDGTPRKRLDLKSLTELGFQSTVSLNEGLRSTYSDYLHSIASGHSQHA